MKKIFLILAFALTVSVANAWNRFADEGVIVLATKHLTPEAKSMVTKYLGQTYYDDTHYLYQLERSKKATHSRDIHYLHLDKDLKPAKSEGDDAYLAIVKALEVIRARDSHSNETVVVALRTLANLICDIHNFGRIRIEGIPHSQVNFKFSVYGGDYGSRKKTSKITWFGFWNSYAGWHTGFSGNLWAEDIELGLGHKREEFAKGNLLDWVAQIGADAQQLYGRINEEYVMTRRERNELEEVNYAMMARAGYRLAALLNEAAK